MRTTSSLKGRKKEIRRVTHKSIFKENPTLCSRWGDRGIHGKASHDKLMNKSCKNQNTEKIEESTERKESLQEHANEEHDQR